MILCHFQSSLDVSFCAPISLVPLGPDFLFPSMMGNGTACASSCLLLCCILDTSFHPTTHCRTVFSAPISLPRLHGSLAFLRNCEWEGDVVAVVAPLGGVAQVVRHGVKVVGVHGEEGQEKDEEVRVEVKGEVEELREKRSSWMA